MSIEDIHLLHKMRKDIFVVFRFDKDGKHYEGAFTTRRKANARKSLGEKFEDNKDAKWSVQEYDLC